MTMLSSLYLLPCVRLFCIHFSSWMVKGCDLRILIHWSGNSDVSPDFHLFRVNLEVTLDYCKFFVSDYIICKLSTIIDVKYFVFLFLHCALGNRSFLLSLCACIQRVVVVVVLNSPPPFFFLF